MPSSKLALSKAPYADATQHILGGDWYLIISLIASILCIGTLNAWALASGQIALGLANDGLAPKLLGRTNQYGAPYVAICIAACGTVPLLFLTTHTNLATQIAVIIDFSVTAFLFVYVTACLAFFKLLHQKQQQTLWNIGYGLIALTFCLWILSETSWQTLVTAALFSLTGLPILAYMRKR